MNEGGFIQDTPFTRGDLSSVSKYATTCFFVVFYKTVEYVKVVWIPTKCCSWTMKQRKGVVFPVTTSQERKPVPWGEWPVWSAQCPHSQKQEAVSWPLSLPAYTSRLGWEPQRSKGVVAASPPPSSSKTRSPCFTQVSLELLSSMVLRL